VKKSIASANTKVALLPAMTDRGLTVSETDAPQLPVLAPLTSKSGVAAATELGNHHAAVVHLQLAVALWNIGE